MQFGICLSIKEILTKYPQDLDFAELSVPDVMEASADDCAALRRAVAEGLVRTCCAKQLLPGSLRLTGPDVDFEAVRAYVEKSFYRLAELGVSVLVFGSGKAKHVPDGFPMPRAMEQLCKIGRIFAREAKKYGQRVAVEPLSYSEVNVINTVSEAADYARAVGLDNFGILVDFYHFDQNNDNEADIAKHKELLLHTHFAAPKSRGVPRCESEWDFFVQSVNTLKSVGYDGTVSFEGIMPKDTDLAHFATEMKRRAAL